VVDGKRPQVGVQWVPTRFGGECLRQSYVGEMIVMCPEEDSVFGTGRPIGERRLLGERSSRNSARARLLDSEEEIPGRRGGEMGNFCRDPDFGLGS
jgi:hypothetical protein